ncbi:hypothetical protein HTY52_22880 [Cupriavidus taiwanensis]|uniref:hypothetical protein n=1 Tax=Cupriavidus taiwanensis TaxID=164546 RepID=UPI0015746C00|nr:hypothetical protein [Cupriavidus taiwanensis]NSX16941.1 hypothetical protein [Cupriavidus taiwanensis]
MATEIDPLAFQKGFAATQEVFDSTRRNRLAELALSQREREMQQQNALAGVVGNTSNYDSSGNLKREVLPQIAAASPAALPQYQKLISDQTTQQAAQQKLQRDQLMAQFDWADKNMAGVQNQAQWDEFRARAAQVYPDVAARLPAQFDPATIQANRMKVIPILDQWKAERQQEQFQQQQATARRGQDLSAQTALQSQQVTMRGQDMTDQRARDLNAVKAADSKIAQAQQERVRDANDALGLLDQAEKLIPQATGSYFGAGRDLALRSIGAATEAGNAAAQLRALEGALVSKMPKMSGPQSDKDVAMYRQMAGQIGDPTVPSETKQAAIRTIREIQNKYAGNPMAPAAASTSAAAPDQATAIQELRRRAATDPALAAKLKAMGY